MAPIEVEITISSAKDLKNVNWRYGDLKPYAIVWIDPVAKCSTRVDEHGDTSPIWDEKLTIPLHDRRIDESTLFIDIIHANAQDRTKPLIASTRIPLKEVVDEVGLREKYVKSLKLKRPSGRPQGKLEVKIEVREFRYYAPPPVAYAPPYGQVSRDYSAPPYAYGAPPPAPYGAAPPAGYPYNPSPYGQPAYAAPVVQEKKKGGMGVGTGVAVGAAAGLLGGLAIAGGVGYMENKIADDAAERVENDQAYDDGDLGDDDY